MYHTYNANVPAGLLLQVVALLIGLTMIKIGHARREQNLVTGHIITQRSRYTHVLFGEALIVLTAALNVIIFGLDQVVACLIDMSDESVVMWGMYAGLGLIISSPYIMAKALYDVYTRPVPAAYKSWRKRGLYCPTHCRRAPKGKRGHWLVQRETIVALGEPDFLLF